ncbi:uncharacterized protein K452DRAFT_284352 [Aplosporella prunicola CBS 121167]|uniref:Uncharacterized protein n=1 Tax=Aplosporella prunicola CBS 121167 TaxID=1176127 RepID=A0A6A6BLH4_9PEZI|nr:uncharacterized protein K452DRAFT_284352 [Aplosporella prunicola CBS 121167]KAF2144962.1 hypothetical protein K452DRAFT_284352 [Aplosporella prunicola CBS 121167]
MDGGLDASWRADDDKSSATSSDDASSKFDTDSLPTYGTYSTQFLQTIVGFLVHNFPVDYEFDPSAPHLPSMPRLPPLPESRPTSRNPRLSQIRFGQVPEQSGTSRYVISLLSSIFLSLPFPILKALLEDYVLSSRLSRARIAQIAQSVVEEREIRRRKIWKIQMTHPNAFERDDALRHNLLWTERVERVEPSQQALGGFRLARSHQGIDTPASTLSNKSSERVG